MSNPNSTISRLDWQRATQSKHNKRLAENLKRVADQPEERQEVVRAAMRLWEQHAQLPKPHSSKDIFSLKAVILLDYYTRILGNQYEMPARAAYGAREGAVTTVRAILNGKQIDKVREIAPRTVNNAIDWGNYLAEVPIGERREYSIEQWKAERAGEVWQQSPNDDGILDAEYIFAEDEHDDEILSAEIITGASKKPTRRIPVTVRRFEKYGILRGDTAIVVMNGDIRVGELGYFAVVYKPYESQPAYRTNYLAFVCEQDSTCYDSSYNGRPRTPESLCLRSDDIAKCQGHHNASVNGRVCAVERKRQPVEHSLTLRPFDERIDGGDRR